MDSVPAPAGPRTEVTAWVGGNHSLLDNWLPHQFSFLAILVSATLERMYGERFNLSVTGWRVIAVLGGAQPMSAKELGVVSGMDQVSISRAVAKVVSMGLVSRGSDPTDRRKAELRLTDKGTQVYEEVLPLARATEAVLLADLPKEKVAQLHEIMDYLMARAKIVLSPERNWQTILEEGRRAGKR